MCDVYDNYSMVVNDRSVGGLHISWSTETQLLFRQDNNGWILSIFNHCELENFQIITINLFYNLFKLSISHFDRYDIWKHWNGKLIILRTLSSFDNNGVHLPDNLWCCQEYPNCQQDDLPIWVKMGEQFFRSRPDIIYTNSIDSWTRIEWLREFHIFLSLDGDKNVQTGDKNVQTVPANGVRLTGQCYWKQG